MTSRAPHLRKAVKKPHLTAPASGLPLHLTRLSYTKELPSFTAFYRKDHCPGPAAVAHILSEWYHPFYIKTKRRWEEKFKNDSNALWWLVTGANSRWKPVVCTWFKRRVRQAYLEELKARKLDDGCRPVTGVTGARVPALIKGTLQLHVKNPDPAIKYTQIRNDCGLIIDELFRKFPAVSRRSKSGDDHNQEARAAKEDNGSKNQSGVNAVRRPRRSRGV